MKTVLRIALALALLGACGDRHNGVDAAWVRSNLLERAPAGLDRVDIDFDGKVTYLGSEVVSGQLVPGGQAEVTHYWKVIAAPGVGWRLFTHVVGTGDEWMNVDGSLMRVGHPVSEWKPGQIIRDRQQFALPKTWSAKIAEVRVGLYRGSTRMVPAIRGDGDRRATVVTFSVDPLPPAVYRARRSSSPIVVDGVADEPAWKSAAMSPHFSDAEGGRAVGKSTRARLTWDAQFLYVFIEVEDADVFSRYNGHDDPLWKEDVVEVFIDADKNRRGYVELQVNPNNAHFDAWFATTRARKGDFDWNSGMRSAVVVHGTASNRDDTDRGWDVELAIPLGDVRGRDARMAIATPPKVGDSWRLNVVRIEKPADKSLAASSWNPITIRDFHALGRMLTVVFADEQGRVTASSTLPVTAPE